MLSPVYKNLKMLRKLSSPTIRNLIGYMSLTYSITALLVLLGLIGHLEMATDIAIVQGAVLATFYVLSGDARHLILTEQILASNALFFRLILVIPLGLLSYFLSVDIAHVEIYIAVGLILRRVTEWLAEIHVTEIERTHGEWAGWYLQPILFLMLIAQIATTESRWLIWIWAISPLFFSIRFLLNAKFNSSFKMGWENIASTAVIGFTGYIQRIFIVSLVGKAFAGLLFPGFAIGSFVGTMAANVVGPTLSRKGVEDSIYVKIIYVIMMLVGFLAFIFSNNVLYKTIGLSVMGGAVMIAAQQARLFLLKTTHTLQLDLMFQVALVLSVPTLYYVGNSSWLSTFYLVGSILAWVFYKGNGIAMKVSQMWRTRMFVVIVLGIVTPVFYQLSGHIYNQSQNPIIDSLGRMENVPLPISLIACYGGIILFSIRYASAKSAIWTIAAMFLLLIASTMLTGGEGSKLTLLAQYIIPTAALLLGMALAQFDVKLLAKTILYFLVVFIPLQLIMTWTQGELALMHYMYVFSVYQHYQYVPLVMVSLFAWAWVELRDTHSKWIYFIAPWMAMYVAAGNSILALAGLVVFSATFTIISKRKMVDVLVPILILAVIGGYFHTYSKKAAELLIKHQNQSQIYREIYLDKFFDIKGNWLYATPAIPINVLDRIKFATIYIHDMVEHPSTFFIGHPAPPERELASSAHNYYLDLIYNFGVFASLPLLVLIVYTTIRVRASISKEQSVFWFSMIVFYLVVVDSNFKVTLRQPYPGIIAFLMWGILLQKITPKRVFLPDSSLSPI